MDLFALIDTFPPGEAPFDLDAVTDLALGLQFLHQVGRAHGDVKDENVLVALSCVGDKDVVTGVQWIDLGSAHVKGSRTDLTSWRCPVGEFLGTMRYAAPEILIGVEKGDGRSTFNPMKQDMWAFGNMLYLILFGDDIKTPEDEDRILVKWRDFAPKSDAGIVRCPETCEPVSEEICKLLDGLLEADEKKRWDSDELVDRLSNML